VKTYITVTFTRELDTLHSHCICHRLYPTWRCYWTHISCIHVTTTWFSAKE